MEPAPSLMTSALGCVTQCTVFCPRLDGGVKFARRFEPSGLELGRIVGHAGKLSVNGDRRRLWQSQLKQRGGHGMGHFVFRNTCSSVSVLAGFLLFPRERRAFSPKSV